MVIYHFFKSIHDNFENNRSEVTQKFNVSEMNGN